MPLTLPTPQDSALLLQDTTTKTAAYQTPGFDLGSGFAPGGLGKPAAGIVHVTAVDLSSGNETYAFTLEESADNVTFVTIPGAVFLLPDEAPAPTAAVIGDALSTLR